MYKLFAIYGQEVLNGIQLGMGIFEEEGRGKIIELIIRDTEGDPERAAQIVEDLALKRKALAIIGPLASKPAVASAKKAQELGIPIITLTQKEGITDIGDMVFRHFLIPHREVQKIVDKTMNEMGFNRFGILYPDNSYGRFFMNLFWDQVEERGGSITAIEPYKPEQTDFAQEIKRMVGLYYPRPESVKKMLRQMKSLENEDKMHKMPDSEIEAEPIVDFDAVFIPDSYHQFALIAPQFPFHNVFNVQFLGTSLWQDPQLIETAGDYVQNAIFPSGFYSGSESEEVISFVNLYRENFEEEPGVLAATGYDTMRFLNKLLTNNQIKTRKEFLDTLLTFNDFIGVTGEISFDHHGEVIKAPILLRVSGKTFEKLN